MIRLFFVTILVITLAGCATAGHMAAGMPRPSISGSGFYHEVKPGETLSYLADIYKVDLRELTRLNRIPDISKIEVGQLILVPQAKPSAARRDISRRRINAKFVWPVRGRVVSNFGDIKDMVKNKGIDIRTGDLADVVASGDGRITFVSDNMEGYGKIIIIDHGNGFQTVYAYNAKNFVRADQEVKQGQVIAKVGNTGRADYPTLHFQIRDNHRPEDPLDYLP